MQSSLGRETSSLPVRDKVLLEDKLVNKIASGGDS